MNLPVGRPSAITPEVLQKLEQAFLMDCTDEEACLYAGISVRTLYNFQKENDEFLQRKQLLKQNPFLIARQSILKALENDPRIAIMYMERKKKSEFSLRREFTGKDGAPLLSQEALNEVLESLDKA